MEKLMKNWIFTLIICMLLTILAVLMILGALDVMSFAKDVLHLVAAVILALYIAFVLIPLLPRYQGTARAFLVGEIALLILTVIAQASMQAVRIPGLSGLAIFSVFGLALWLRGAVATIRAYLTQGENRPALWMVCCFIIVSAIGVWQMVRPLIADKHLLWFIGIVSVVAAVLFGYATAKNRGGKSKKKKGGTTAVAKKED